MVLTLHHLNNSRSQRILWLLEELGVDYELKTYQRGPDLLAQEDLLKLHPLGKSPLITDGDITVAESGAIIEYIVDKYGEGRLVPPAGDEEAKRRYSFALHFAEASLLLPLLARFYFNAFAPEDVAKKAIGARFGPEHEKNLSFLEGELKSRFFTGDELTAADIQLAFALEFADVQAPLKGKYPKLAAFLEASKARPAYKEALAKGGDYDLNAFSSVLK